jgi:hypothetical protein
VSAGVKFDLFADGAAVNTGWVSSSDGLLVLDRNSDGSVNDGSELFGSSTTLADGSKATDAYAALRELDSNADGMLSNADAAFADLRVWVDANSDGVSETGELRTLSSLGITQISTNAVAELSKDNGNLIGLTSTYQTADGETHAAADVWFVADRGSAATTPAEVDNAIAALNTTTVPVDANSNVDALKTIEIVPPLPVASETAQAADGSDLRARVSNLAQALGAFNATDAADGAGTSPSLDPTKVQTTSANSLAVVSMVDVMKQFDANGNLVAPVAPAAAALGKSLTVPGTQDGVNNAILATPNNKLSG